jgi:hypothetical protein
LLIFLSVLHSKDPEAFANHLVSAINKENNDILAYFFTVSYQSTLEAVRQVPELQKFVTKLESFEAFERQQKVFERSPEDELHVLNHGE